MTQLLKFQNSRAFTLIEVLASVALLSIALLGIIQGQSGSVKTVLRSESLSQAYALAEEKMAEIEIELQKTNFEALKEEEKGEFENEALKKFTWRRTLEKVDLGCFLPTDQEEDARDQQGFFTLAQDLFERAVRKIIIRVEWQEGGRTRFAELTQLYVRFEDIQNF